MGSPFPGVDPYIEDQHFWPDFHQSFMTYWRDLLLEALPDNYDARLEERVQRIYLSNGAPDDPRHPDIAVEQLRPSRRRRKSAKGGTLVLEPVTIALPLLDESRESYIQILHRPERTLVAVLELLSPSNKTGDGFHDYLNKRVKLLAQEIHLVEVDLLLEGQRLPMRSALPPGDCYAIVSRSEQRPNAEVFAWTIRDRLPTIPIPLRAPDPDVQLDLGKVFNTTYERGQYRRTLDYSRPLRLPLMPRDKRWVQERVKPRRK